MLGDCLTTTFYSWNGCKFISEEYDIKFTVVVVDEQNKERSDSTSRRLRLPDEIHLHLMVDCTSDDVIANWKLTSYPYNVDEYCLQYQCDSVKEEMVGCIAISCELMKII